jgi:hypothetical protein
MALKIDPGERNLILKRIHIFLLMAAFMALAAGCAGPGRYQKVGLFAPGYDDLKRDDGVWEIVCNGGEPGFAEECAGYRCAEFTFEKGCRYYVLLATEGGSKGDRAGREGEEVRRGVEQRRVSYMIRIYKTMPDTQNVYDAYDILNTTPVPMTDQPYTVEQRLKDGQGLKAQ